MEPIKFEGQNITFGENQPGVLPLPAHKQPDGTVTMCIEISKEDLKQIRKTGRIWAQTLTYNQPLQPLRFLTEQPELPVNQILEGQIKAFKKLQAEQQTKAEKLQKSEQNAKNRKEGKNSNTLRKC